MKQAEPAELGRTAGPIRRGPGAHRWKVLHLGKYYPPHMGGIETHLQALCTELNKELDLRVVVANEDHRDREDVLGDVAVSRVSTRLTFASTPLCPGMTAQVRRSDADIVHVHLPNPMSVMAYLASGHRGRLVVTYHSDTVRQKVLGCLFEPFLHQFLRRSSAIIATSPDYRRTSTVLARYLDRCHVIPYGIAVQNFEQYDQDAVQAVRRRYGERLIIAVGRLVYYKGFEYLIRAMTQVRGTLLIVGDGPLREKLQGLSRELGLEGKVVFAGEIQNEQTVPYYHAAQLFALPSIARSEAFGIVQIEAMAAGIPVVNTSLDSGVPFVSLHEKTGLTVPPRDPEALASAINRLLDDEPLRHSFAAAARERARQEFSVETMTRRTLALYDDVMKQERRDS